MQEGSSNIPEATNKTARHAALREDYENADLKASYAALSSARDLLASQNEALAKQNEMLTVQNEALTEEISKLLGSISWRLTTPIRGLRHLVARTSESKVRRSDPDTAASPPREGQSPSDRPPSGLRKMPPEDVVRLREAFDEDFYLASYPEVAASGADALGHYMRQGWKEGKDPSPGFSTSYYLEHSPQLVVAGVNPFLHWVRHGAGGDLPILPFARRLELRHYEPLVSAIVPNYNHARFLGERLDSILSQTYPNVEILVLDDCSTDESREVIEGYRKRYPERIRTLFNDENSGNVFRQWRRGIENSAGELVWICESDDFCEPDFLEGLVEDFRDRSVSIAFGRIQFSDRDGNFQKGMDGYREGAEAEIWASPVVRPAARWFGGGFGVNNVIANVGGCVIRRQSLPKSVWDEAEGYSILGDWFLYANFAGGGQIAYEPSSVAYFRQHGVNTSVSSFVTPPYYEEHERLMTFLRKKWDIPDSTVERFHEKVSFQFTRLGMEEKLGALSDYCDREKLLAVGREERHILVALLGFHPGGGEVFPLHLANELVRQGHKVSVLALDMVEAKQEMLGLLDDSIPVYDCNWVREYGADRFLRDAGISLIHSHMILLEGFFFEERQIKTEVPYLVSLHGSYESAPMSNERLMRILLGVDHFVYTADKNLEPFRVLPLSGRAFTKLTNAMPNDDLPFPKSRRELGIAEDAVVFTLVARGIKRKGWRASVAAFRKLRDANPAGRVHLLLCGDGEETEKLRREYGEDPDITFLGYQARINGLYRLSDIALVPTRFAGESFPLCITQALQTRTPVISTRVGEIPTMMDTPGGAAGILLENERDTESYIHYLTEAMFAMMDSADRERFARLAEEKGRTFSMEKVAKDYTVIYEKLVRSYEVPEEERTTGGRGRS